MSPAAGPTTRPTGRPPAATTSGSRPSRSKAPRPARSRCWRGGSGPDGRRPMTGSRSSPGPTPIGTSSSGRPTAWPDPAHRRPLARHPADLDRRRPVDRLPFRSGQPLGPLPGARQRPRPPRPPDRSRPARGQPFARPRRPPSGVRRRPESARGLDPDPRPRPGYRTPFPRELRRRPRPRLVARRPLDRLRQPTPRAIATRERVDALTWNGRFIMNDG